MGSKHHLTNIIRVWLFLLCLLNLSSVCSQIWFDGTSSWAGVFCEKNWLLCLRSRSQQRLEISVNVCSDDIFWTGKLIKKNFLTKLSMVGHESECHAGKSGLLSPRSGSQWGLVLSQYNCFYYIFWNADPYATELDLMIHHHMLECLVKEFHNSLQGRGHREGSECQWIFVQKIISELPNILLPNCVWCGIIMSCNVMYWFTIFKVKTTARADMIKIWLFTTSYEPLILFQPNSVWWYIILKSESLMKKGIAMFKVRVTVKVLNVSEYLFW